MSNCDNCAIRDDALNDEYKNSFYEHSIYCENKTDEEDK